jgi:hypothetical protein
MGLLQPFKICTSTNSDMHSRIVQVLKPCHHFPFCWQRFWKWAINRATFLDFLSAFNTIHVPDLISELSHLDSNVTECVYSFLTKLTQRTIADGLTPTQIMTSTGTLQGCCLSPLLISMYIQIRLPLIWVMYLADATCIIGCIGNQSDLHSYFDETSRISKPCSDLNLETWN